MAVTPPVLRGFESWRWYRRFFRDPLPCLIEVRRRFGPLSVFENPLPGPRRGERFVLAVGADFNRQVLGAPADFRSSGHSLKGPPGSAQRRIRRGILAMHGEVHRCHRRLMQPAFSRAAVASTIPLMAPLIDEIIDRWQVGEPLDMFDEMRTVANWVAANVLFGNEDFSASLNIGRMIDRWLVLDGETRKWGMIELDLPGTPYRRQLRHAEALEATIRQLIEAKRRTQSSSDDVLSMLIRAVDSGGSGMSDDDLIAHTISLYGASFETTASALAWTMFLIAQHPACAARLHDEVCAGAGDWPPDSRALEAMPFLDAVIYESMRLMAPVPVTFRRVTRPLDLGGVRLKSGDKVILSPFLTHREPDLFPNPKRFDPSRWLGSRPDPYHYIPFSGGPRPCVGASFAMIEMKLVVARVMQRYRMTVVPGARIDAAVHFTLKPWHGLPIVVHPQDRAFGRSPLTGNINELVDLVSAEREWHEGPERPGLAQDAQPPPRRSENETSRAAQTVG
jgi:cytochrome P450